MISGVTKMIPRPSEVHHKYQVFQNGAENANEENNAPKSAVKLLLTTATPNKAKILGNTEILEYFLDRLSTLHPRLKKTEFVKTLTARLKGIQNLIAENQGSVLTPDQVVKARDLANEAEAAAVARVDEEGNFEKPKP